MAGCRRSDFFKGPRDLKRQHRELRDHVATAGYDVERAVTERSKDRLSSAEFQARAVRTKRTEEKLAATLAVASNDSDKAWEELQALRKERAALAESLDDIPKLRVVAKGDGFAEGIAAASREQEKALEGARQHEERTEQNAKAVRAEVVRLRALTAELEADLAARGPRPELPSGEAVLKLAVDGMSSQLRTHLREVKFKGQPLMDVLEERMRRTYDIAAARGTHMPTYDAWRSRTVEMQRKITLAEVAGFMDPAAPPAKSYDGLEK